MKILYGVQGTGHGHINRAKALIPILREFVDVDVLLSGYNFHMELDGGVDFKKRGISLTYDSKGSVDLFETAINLKPVTFMQDVQSIPLQDYDFVLCDFEPVTAWAAKLAGVRSVGLSHQASFMSVKSPRPHKKSLLAEGIIRHFAPCDEYLGTHYIRYDNFIEPPVLRQEILDLKPTEGNHVTVYLPAFSHHSLVSIFNNVPEIDWEIFSPECEKEYHFGNTSVKPVGHIPFLNSIESSVGFLCSAGFEGPSEAMYLNKKLMVIPIKNQYEQLCNAAAIEELGGDVVYEVGDDFVARLRNWIRFGKKMELPEVCDIRYLAQRVIELGAGTNSTVIPEIPLKATGTSL